MLRLGFAALMLAVWSVMLIIGVVVGFGSEFNRVIINVNCAVWTVGVLVMVGQKR